MYSISLLVLKLRLDHWLRWAGALNSSHSMLIETVVLEYDVKFIQLQLFSERCTGRYFKVSEDDLSSKQGYMQKIF